MIDRDDTDLTTIVAVNETRSVDQRQALFECEPTAWLNKTGKTFRDRNGDAGGNEYSLTGRECDVDRRVQIQTSITGMGVCRKRQAGIDPSYRKSHGHSAEPFEFSRELVEVLKLFVHRSESNVRDLVEVTKAPQHHVTEVLALDLVPECVVEL